MKNLGFKIALVVCVMVIGALAFKVYFTQPSIKYVEKKPSQIIDNIKTEAKIIATTVDKKGFNKTVFERKNAIISNGDITKLPVSQAVLDSLRLDNLTKDKKLQIASVINATLSAKQLVALKKIDSLKKLSAVYTDDNLTVVYYPDSIGGKFDVNYKLTLLRQDYKKRKNFLSPYRQYTDILSPDKRITINGMQAITIESPNVKRFGIGLQAGYHYNPLTASFTPSFGVGISYNLIRF